MVDIKTYVNIQKELLKEIVSNSLTGYRLDIFQIGDNPASNSYVKGKLKDCEEVGIKAYHYKIDEIITQEKLLTAVKAIEPKTNGIIIQLPVPKHIDPDDIMREVDPRLDVDGFVYDRHKPCTPRGIVDWLEYNHVSLASKNVVIIGRSNIVGKPLAKMMTDRDATVTLCHSKTSAQDLYRYVKHADIIVSAVGQPKRFGWSIPADVYDNKIFIDVGINRDENGKLCGDFDREFLETQGHYVTPVPGGVGLLTRISLLKNVVGI